MTRVKTAWIAKYAEPLKAIVTALISIVVAVWGVFLMFDKQQDTLDDVVEAVNEIKINQDSIMMMVDEFNGQLEAVNENTVLMGNYVIKVDNRVQSIDKAIRVHLRTMQNANLEHYARITEILDESVKKNDNWIPPPSIK